MVVCEGGEGGHTLNKVCLMTVLRNRIIFLDRGDFAGGGDELAHFNRRGVSYISVRGGKFSEHGEIFRALGGGGCTLRRGGIA